MKRHGNLIGKIADFDNLHEAYRKAIRGRRFQCSSLRFREHLEEHLITLHNELTWGMYKPGEYRTFNIYEPKKRVIYAAPFRDRVVHHAIMNITGPIWEGLFISDSYACRAGKGVHAGLDCLTNMLRSAHEKWAEVYCLKGDISKFFTSINHHVFMRIIQKKIKCRETVALFDSIVFSIGNHNDPESCNLPIGNLVSQWGANLYLNELDLFVKHHFKAKYYLRYMDDFVILAPDKHELHRMLAEIEHFLGDTLKLRLNHKTAIFPCRQGIDFMGFRVWENHRLLRKSSAKRMGRRLKWIRAGYQTGRIRQATITARIQSWLAHCAHCNSWRIRSRIMRGAVFVK